MFHCKCRILLLVASITLASCAVGPDFHQPKPPQVTAYTSKPLPTQTVGATGNGGEVQYFQLGQAIPAKWWQLFHSPQLNDLITKGLHNSPTVEIGKAALRQAQENANAEFGSAFYPTISASLTGQRQRISNASFGNSNNPGNVFNLYNANVNVSYTLDLFGGSRRELESLISRVDYQQFELEATYLSLSANIVTTAITVAALQAQIVATEEMIHSQENQLNIVNKQLIAGGVSQIEVLSQQTLLAQTRAMLPTLEKNYTQASHALAVLIGILPSDYHTPTLNLNDLKLPTELPLSIPADLVRQRPDVRASAALLHAASAQIGVVTAGFFPQLSLQGNSGSSTNIFQHLLRANTNVWSLEAQLLQPLFNGGSLMAKRRASVAAFEQASAQYRQTVLQAFQNVADSLGALEVDARALQSQEAAESSARETLLLTEKQFKFGAVSYLMLLNAERQYQQAHIARIQAQATRYIDTAALFQALGGGWWSHLSDNLALDDPGIAKQG